MKKLFFINLFYGFWSEMNWAIASFFALFPFFILLAYFEVQYIPYNYLSFMQELFLSFSFVALSMLIFFFTEIASYLINPNKELLPIWKPVDGARNTKPAIYATLFENGETVYRLHTESRKDWKKGEEIKEFLILLPLYILLNWFFLFVFLPWIRL